MQLELGVVLAQARQQQRQQIGGDGRDHAEVERAAEQPALVPAVIHKIVHLGQDAGGAGGDLAAMIRERHA